MRTSAFVAMLASAVVAQTDEQKAAYPNWSMYTGIYRYKWEPIEYVSDNYTMTLMHITGTYIIGDEGEILGEVNREEQLGWGRPDYGPVILQNINGSTIANVVAMYFNYSTDGQPMPFELYDRGFDVYFACTRGSEYCQKHAEYTPMDDEFWDFNLIEDGAADINAAIDAVYARTNKKVSFIGESTGNMGMFAGLIRDESQFTNLNKYVAMDPCKFSPMVTDKLATQTIAQAYVDTDIKEMGGETWHLAVEKLTDTIGRVAVVDLLVNLQMHTQITNYPTKTLIHMGQNAAQGKFTEWSDDFMDISKWNDPSDATEYDFSAIKNTKIALFGSNQTNQCGASDFTDIQSALGPVAQFSKLYETDFIEADTDSAFFDDLTNFLKPADSASLFIQ